MSESSNSLQKVGIDQHSKVLQEFEDLQGLIKIKDLNATNPLPLIQPNQVFANTELHLKDISVYGFDYDYTIASYRRKTKRMSYNEAKKYMVKEMGYPNEILDFKYNEDFAIVGLHFDITTGCLIKLSSYSHIEEDSVYIGKRKLSKEEVKKIYPRSRITDIYLKESLKFISDLFAVPLANFLADIIDYFVRSNIPFDTEHVFNDVLLAFDRIHKTHRIHKVIDACIDDYIFPEKGFVNLIRRLLAAKKKLFILTNNQYKYLQLGAELIFAEIVNDKKYGFNHWTDIFDVVITLASKPNWFDKNEKFRVIDNKTLGVTMEVVEKFQKGKIYRGGSFDEFKRLSKYEMSEVLYMGDNIYNDLMSPRKFCQWRTVAIIKELQFEIEKMNKKDYQFVISVLFQAENLFSKIRGLRRKNGGKKIKALNPIVPKLQEMIKDLLKQKKEVFNKQFGSIFRANDSKSKFLHNIERYADLYTSNVENFDNYQLDSAFFVKRKYFAHEINLDCNLKKRCLN